MLMMRVLRLPPKKDNEVEKADVVIKVYTIKKGQKRSGKKYCGGVRRGVPAPTTKIIPEHSRSVSALLFLFLFLKKFLATLTRLENFE